LAQEVLRGIRRDRHEIQVGRAKILIPLYRLIPALVESAVMKK
jgi:hypothetical protein